MLVGEELVALLVAFSDAGQVAGQGAGIGIVAVEVLRELGAVAGDAGAEFFQEGEIFDQLLDLFEADPDYKHFMLDGHTIPLEDYLEIRPERFDDIERVVQQGKLLIGPWYIIPDEALPGGEALVRNFLRGHRVAKMFGPVMKVGYIPDPFGQIVAQASTDKEEILVVECDPKRSEEVRRNWPFLRDRRIDAYGSITNRWLDGSRSAR